jgi:small subunit ribosomal protein S6
MPYYEHVFLARQDLTVAQVETLLEGFTNVLADGKGRVHNHEYWGLRTLAYRIAKNRKAHYVMLTIDAPPAALAEMERQVGLNEDIIRFMTVRVDELSSEPSAMTRRGERSEREGGREGRDGRDRDGGAPRGEGRGEGRGERPRREPRAAM